MNDITTWYGRCITRVYKQESWPNKASLSSSVFVLAVATALCFRVIVSPLIVMEYKYAGSGPRHSSGSGYSTGIDKRVFASDIPHFVLPLLLVLNLVTGVRI